MGDEDGAAVAASANALIITGTDIAAGDNFSCALMENEVRCWGANPFGQLGDGTTAEKWAPVVVGGISDAGALGIGAQFACAVRAGGALSCWGQNSNGQLGDNTVTNRSTPVAVLLPGTTEVEGGLNHACAVANSAAYCWGNNGSGKLGDNTTTERHLPTAVSGLASPVDWVDPGDSFTCAVAGASDTAYCWGLNANGQLGDGTTTERHLPVSTGLTGAVQVSAGALHACALKSDGHVWCWGFNGSGRLGDGTTTQRTSPVEVKDTSNAALTGVVDITAGASHTCAVKATGEVYCWGLNANGQLGDGTYMQSTKAKLVLDVADAVKVSAGEIHTCAMRETGQAVCWGFNGNGRLGDGFVTQANTPVGVSESCGATRVATGDVSSCAIESLGQVVCWGGNGSGQLGIGSYGEHWAPQTVHDISDMAGLTAGGQHTCAVEQDGSLWCWGANSLGQVGDGTTLPRTAPRAVFLQAGVTKPDSDCTYSEHGGHGYFFCRNASTWTSARDKCRAAGIGMELVRVDGAAENAFVEGGLASNTWLGGNDRTVEGTWRWAEGGVDNGTQFWQGKGTSQGGAPVGDLYSAWLGTTEPDDAGGADCAWTDTVGNWFDTVCTVNNQYVCEGATLASTPATLVSGGGLHTCAVSDAGEVWCWGHNATGQVGDGTTAQRKLPTKTAALGATATDVDAGDNFTCAALTGGTVKCWGNNSDGQLGDNSTTQHTSPTTAVVNVSGATQVSAGYRHACAAQSDGQVKCWGHNLYGALGDGTTTQRLTAVTVLVNGTSNPLDDVVKVTAGQWHTCARQGDGDVWCWGFNSLGRLGDGTQTNRNKAVQVINLPDDAVDVAAGLEHTCAALITGDIYCWGANGSGKLGNGTSTYSTVPGATAGLQCRLDDCPTDPAKTEPGQCGCGSPDTDTDSDTVADCADACPEDAAKTEPGPCGCGHIDTDTDSDGTADCIDVCPLDTSRIVAPCSPDVNCTFSSFDGTDYFFCDGPADYPTAKSKCESASLHLVRIDGAQENAFLASSISNGRWVGGTDGVSEGDWRWEIGGDQFWQGAANGTVVNGAYASWDTGQPDDGGGAQDCLQLGTSGAWSDAECVNGDEFICEGPAPVFAFPRGCYDTGGLEPGSPWPMRRLCPGGVANTPLFGAHLNIVNWSVNLGGDIRNAPAIAADGTLYVGSDANKLFAIAPNGTVKWDFTTGGDVRSSAAIGRGGTIYFGSNDGKLYALSRTGSQLWAVETGSPVETSPLLGGDGTVYIGTTGPTGAGVYAINPDGTQKWFVDLPAGVTSEIALANTGSLYVGSGNHVLGINDRFGVLVQDYDLSSTVTGGPVASGSGTTYVGTADGRLVAIDGARAAIVGTFQVSCPGACAVGDPALSEDESTVYFGSENGSVHAIDQDASLRWSFATGGFVKSSPVVAGDGVIYVGSDDGKLYALKGSLDDSDRLLWQASLGGAVRSAIAIGRQGTVYAGSDSDLLSSIGANTGKCPTGTICNAYEALSGCMMEGLLPALGAPPPCGPIGQCPAGGSCVTLQPGAPRACYVPCYTEQP